ncbi:MAG: hypothetical protein OEV89_01125 [Desulfobulbaceae bacterium]|nr:hypothetical protein [Desulfobulbaceae bacterium]HIJ89447.1 hypothetical protein [Deltaproteobacteria bacterium]
MESRKNLVLVDVRSSQELHEGSIFGSRFIPYGEPAKGRMTLATGHPLLLICAVGQYFFGTGYGEICNPGGGISAWKAAGLPIKR